MPEKNEGRLWHQSGVNLKGEPFIQLVKDNRVIAQMDPQEARNHALAILEAAEAAEQDSFLMDLLRTKVGLENTQIAQIIADFRRFRMEKTGKKGGPYEHTDWVMPEKPQ